MLRFINEEGETLFQTEIISWMPSKNEHVELFNARYTVKKILHSPAQNLVTVYLAEGEHSYA